MIPCFANGQNLDLVINSGEKVFIHSEGVLSIFSNVTNSGSIATAMGSKVIFSGERWNNTAGSILPDESESGLDGVGGIFTFKSIIPVTQYILISNSLESNSGFPNLNIANDRNVILSGSNLFIRKNLNFEHGHILLKISNIIMATNSTITGYNKDSFIVTGGRTTGGTLARSASGKKEEHIIFPVGTTEESYTPLQISYSGIAQSLNLRVFEDRYDRATWGIPDQGNSVNKTWHLNMIIKDPNAEMSVKTQHNSVEEGLEFSTRRTESFISRFQSDIERWDIIAALGSKLGSINPLDPLSGSFVSSRDNLKNLSINEYFSITVAGETSILGLRIPEGISPNNDGVNDLFVIENLKASDNVRLEIYNNGQVLVYKDLNYKNTFEGTGNQNGLFHNILPNGTYYYIININNGKAHKGFIILNR